MEARGADLEMLTGFEACGVAFEECLKELRHADYILRNV